MGRKKVIRKAKENACPKCGERRISKLLWIDSYTKIECQTCLFIETPDLSVNFPRDYSVT